MSGGIEEVVGAENPYAKYYCQVDPRLTASKEAAAAAGASGGSAGAPAVAQKKGAAARPKPASVQAAASKGGGTAAGQKKRSREASAGGAPKAKRTKTGPGGTKGGAARAGDSRLEMHAHVVGLLERSWGAYAHGRLAKTVRSTKLPGTPKVDLRHVGLARVKVPEEAGGNETRTAYRPKEGDPELYRAAFVRGLAAFHFGLYPGFELRVTDPGAKGSGGALRGLTRYDPSEFFCGAAGSAERGAERRVFGALVCGLFDPDAADAARGPDELMDSAYPTAHLTGLAAARARVPELLKGHARVAGAGEKGGGYARGLRLLGELATSDYAAATRVVRALVYFACAMAPGFAYAYEPLASAAAAMSADMDKKIETRRLKTPDSKFAHAFCADANVEWAVRASFGLFPEAVPKKGQE